MEVDEHERLFNIRQSRSSSKVQEQLVVKKLILDFRFESNVETSLACSSRHNPFLVQAEQLVVKKCLMEDRVSMLRLSNIRHKLKYKLNSLYFNLCLMLR